MNFLETNKPVFWNLAIFSLLIVGILVAVSGTHADPDLWGHLRFGLDAIEKGEIPSLDPYSYLTGDQPWINHQWLAEVLMGLAWLAAGSTGLLLQKIALWLLIYLILFRAVNRPPLYTLRAGLLLALSMPLMAPIYITIRPQVYSALLFTLTLLIIQQAENGGYRWLWAALPIFALWPNLHGAFLIGLGALGSWGLIHMLLNRSKDVFVRVLPPLILAAASTLLNPYGIELWVHLLSHLGDTRLEITEWQPLQVHSLLGVIYLGWIIAAAMGWGFSRRPRRIPLLVTFAWIAYLPLAAERHLMFMAIALPLLSFIHIGDAWDRFMPARPSPKNIRWGAILLPVLTAIVLLIAKPPQLSEISLSEQFPLPFDNVYFLKESDATGNLALHINWGDYAIWHLAPAIKVSIDTRREMAYPESIYLLNSKNILGIGDWDALIDEQPTDLLLVKRETSLDNLMALKPGWVEVYEDDQSVLYAREGSEQARQLIAFAQGYQSEADARYFP